MVLREQTAGTHICLPICWKDLAKRDELGNKISAMLVAMLFFSSGGRGLLRVRIGWETTNLFMVKHTSRA
jgi:hypothetical protein